MNQILIFNDVVKMRVFDIFMQYIKSSIIHNLTYLFSLRKDIESARRQFGWLVVLGLTAF